MYAVVDKSELTKTKSKDRAETSGGSRDKNGINFIVSTSVFLFLLRLTLKLSTFLFLFPECHTQSGVEMYAAVDKRIPKEKATKAAVLDRDNTNQKGICLTQIYNKVRLFSLVLIFLFIDVFV